MGLYFLSLRLYISQCDYFSVQPYVLQCDIISCNCIIFVLFQTSTLPPLCETLRLKRSSTATKPVLILTITQSMTFTLICSTNVPEKSCFTSDSEFWVDLCLVKPMEMACSVYYADLKLIWWDQSRLQETSDFCPTMKRDI